MKIKILFLQGAGEGAYKADDLLAADLRQRLEPNYEVRYPAMPEEESPDYAKWKPCIREEVAALTDGSILAGHSLGASLILKYLAENRVAINLRGVFIISAPYWGGKGWSFEGSEGMALPSDPAAKLQQGVPLFFYQGRSDKIVPFAHLSLYAKKFPKATARALDGRDHQLNNNLTEVALDINKL